MKEESRPHNPGSGSPLFSAEGGLEAKLVKIPDQFLNLGADPAENVRKLVVLCGELLGASRVFYNRLENDQLQPGTSWGVPPGQEFCGLPAAGISADIIHQPSDVVSVIPDLASTPYAADPVLAKDNLKACAAKAVSATGRRVGALCIFYTADHAFTEAEKKFVTLTASAIGTEEQHAAAAKELKNRLIFRDFVAELSTRFINLKTQDVDTAITAALEIVGKFVGADRSYAFLLYDNNTKMNNTHEWCAPGVEPQIQSLKGLSVSNFSYLTACLLRGEILNLRRVAELPAEAQLERLVLESGGIQSMVNVPMIYAGKVIGFLGFDAVRSVREWSEDNVVILRLVGDIIANALERKRYSAMMEASQARYRRVISGVSGYVYTVKIENSRPTGTLHGSGCISVTGYTPEEFAADPLLWLKMVHEEDRQMVQQYARDVLAGKSTRPIEHRLVRKDGAVIWIRNSPVLHFDNQGALLSYDGLVQDITEHKNMQDALVQGERFLADMMESIQDGISILDTELNIVRVNHALEKWHPYMLPLAGKKCYYAYHGRNAPCEVCPSLQTLKTGKAAYEVVPRHGKDGEIVGWLDLYSFPLIDRATGKVKGVIEYVRDITERRMAEEALKKSEERYRTIVEDQTEFITRWLPDGTITFVNEASARLTGKTRQELIGSTFAPFLPAEEQERLKRHTAALSVRNPVATIEHRVITGTGEIRWTQWTNRAIFNEQGAIVEYQSTGRDITERKKIEDAQRQTERFLTNVFSSIQDGLSILDTDYNIIRVNPTMEKWYSHAMPLVGKKCYVAYHCRDIPCETCPTRLTLETKQAACKIVPKRGERGKLTGWLELYSFPLMDKATGHMHGVIEYVRDITDRIKAEQDVGLLNKELLKSNRRLKQLAMRDSHTGLYNHRYLAEIVESEFARAKRYANPLSVIMMDIDYFKSINDVYGHQFGDLILKQFAKLLRKMLRRYDTVVRYGGEEFVIICPGTDRAQTHVLAQRLLDAINLYGFGNTKHVLKLKLSMAVASYPEDKALKGMDLVELADLVLNKVKESGGNKVYSCSDIKREKSQQLKEKKEETDISFLKEKLSKLTKRANQSLIEAVFAFAKTIEVKDHYTGEHAERTVKYATDIAKELGLSAEEIEHIKQAATLHDLGKIGISERILLKKGPLTKSEFTELKKHPQIGADIVRPIQFLHSVIPLILYHHERWDGKGYPSGLKGEEIPIGARIVSIADAYQALTSDRPYRKAYSHAKAIQIIKEEAGVRYDPKIVSVFIKTLHRKK